MSELDEAIEEYFPEKPVPQERLPLIPGMFVQRQTKLPPAPTFTWTEVGVKMIRGRQTLYETSEPGAIATMPQEIADDPKLRALWEAGDRLDQRARTMDRLGMPYPKR